MYDKALAVDNHTYSINHIGGRLILGSVAECYDQTNRIDLANKFYDRILDAEIKQLNKSIPEYFMLHLGNLSSKFEIFKQYGGAIRVYLYQIDHIKKEIKGKDSLYLIMKTKAHLANAYRLSGQFKKSEQLYLKLIEFEKKKGPRSYQISNYIEKLSMVHRKTDRPKSAKKLKANSHKMRVYMCQKHDRLQMPIGLIDICNELKIKGP